MITATEPSTGIVHQIAEDRHTTKCGKNADGWSRLITNLQLAGLVLLCKECD